MNSAVNGHPMRIKNTEGYRDKKDTTHYVGMSALIKTFLATIFHQNAVFNIHTKLGLLFIRSSSNKNTPKMIS